MIRLTPILLLLCLAAHGQGITPPSESPQQFIASVTSFWPAPAPSKTVTFTIPVNLAVQQSSDLQTWTPAAEVKPSITFTVTNDSPQMFYKLPTLVSLAKAELYAQSDFPGHDYHWSRIAVVFWKDGSIRRIVTTPLDDLLVSGDTLADAVSFYLMDKDFVAGNPTPLFTL